MRRASQKLAELIERLRATLRPEQVIHELEKSLQDLGISVFYFAALPKRSSGKLEDVVLASNSPAEFVTEWKKIWPYCPGTLHCQKVAEPFHYLEAPLAHPRSHEAVALHRDFGMENELQIPIIAANGHVGEVGMGGHPKHDLEPHIPILQPIGYAAFYRLIELTDQKTEVPRLSEREKEVLAWIADGKTDWDIGEILAISRRTVEWHIQQAMHKLGATNRTQAVVLAIRDALISI